VVIPVNTRRAREPEFRKYLKILDTVLCRYDKIVGFLWLYKALDMLFVMLHAK